MSSWVKVSGAPAYAIIRNARDQPLLIEDQGGAWPSPSVTNAAERVVEALHKAGLLPNGRRLFYLDSTGQEDEILHEAGTFAGFARGPWAGDRTGWPPAGGRGPKD